MERNIALLIDFENIAAGTDKEGLGKFDIDKVVERVKDKGRILLSRSYADWGRFARFKQGLLTANVTMFELTSHGMQDKNRADIAMVVDCLELAYTRPYIDTFVLVSGDSDFTPLVLKLKELNKNVIGVGTRRSTSRLIINACDEFIFYESIVQKKQPRVPAAVAVQGGLDAKSLAGAQLVVDVLEGMLREDPTPPHASVLKSVILRRQPDFSEEDAGFVSFTRFVESMEKAGLVTLTKDAKSGSWRVDLPNGAGSSTIQESSQAEAPAAPAEDVYLPAGAEPLVRKLNGASLGATSAPARMALLEALVEFVGKKKRRVPPGLVTDELPKRLRRTFPDVGTRTVKGVLRALMEAGKLYHKDGAIVRQPSAPFTVVDEAPALNRAVAEVYLRTLRRAGADLSDMPMLADFLFGDRERTREVEEILAWMTDPAEDDEPYTPAVEIDEVDLDSLLLADAPDTTPEAPAKPAARSKRPAAKAAPAAEADSLDALLAVEAPAAPAAEEEAPAPKARKPRRRRTDAPEGAGAPAADDMDGILEIDG